ncbi:MAG: hypothetical protein BA866_08530 [Desulfobulbaceae bacterium S5133MH15]|nr:MAG: hypothetical protein BA866_08530 [Desulfobulbaceae bacterium S5133MH15]
MKPPAKNHKWDGVERRKPGSNRRTNVDRRKIAAERRRDTRDGLPGHKRTLRGWIRSLTRTRLGVDRRKGRDRRTITDRRNPLSQARLTREELADLLS